MNFEEIAKLHPKKFTEECALVSVYFVMGKIQDEWFLNYISAQGGAWQELKILKDQIEKRVYIGKSVKRPDLVMQQKDNATVFYIAEAKECFRFIMMNREKIDISLTDILTRLQNLMGLNITPVYSYIIGLDTTGLDGELLTDAVRAESDYIKKSINKLPLMRGGRVCVLAYWDNGNTKFSLTFSETFPKDIEDIFKRIFL